MLNLLKNMVISYKKYLVVPILSLKYPAFIADMFLYNEDDKQAGSLSKLYTEKKNSFDEYFDEFFPKEYGAVKSAYKFVLDSVLSSYSRRTASFALRLVQGIGQKDPFTPGAYFEALIFASLVCFGIALNSCLEAYEEHVESKRQAVEKIKTLIDNNDISNGVNLDSEILKLKEAQETSYNAGSEDSSKFYGALSYARVALRTFLPSLLEDAFYEKNSDVDYVFCHIYGFGYAFAALFYAQNVANTISAEKEIAEFEKIIGHSCDEKFLDLLHSEISTRAGVEYAKMIEPSNDYKTAVGQSISGSSMGY